jgi:hypothetical protein
MISTTTADRQAALLEILKAGYRIDPYLATMLGFAFNVSGKTILDDVQTLGEAGFESLASR